METRETPFHGPSRCSTCLFLPFTLRLPNLYEVPLRFTSLVFLLHQFLSLLCMSCSLHRLSPSSLTLSTSLHSQSIHVMYETFTKLEKYVNCILLFSKSVHMTYKTMTDLNGLSIIFYHSPSLYTRNQDRVPLRVLLVWGSLRLTPIKIALLGWQMYMRLYP